MAALYIFNNNRVLLMYKIKSKAFSNPLWVSVGGHFDILDDNDPDKCIIREFKEETGLDKEDIKELKLRYITLRKTDKELRQQYVYFAELNTDKEVTQTDEGLLEWIHKDDVFSRNMSVNNTAIMKHYFDIGQYDNIVYGGIATIKDQEPFVEFEKLMEFSTKY
jgi:8-oxo-dGTP diphosphatase